MISDGEPQVVRCIAFVDLAGFTALSEAHGDHGAAQTAGRLIEVTSQVLQPGVELVKSLGDAVMLAAPQVMPLIASVEALADRWRDQPGSLLLRGGMHIGTVIADGGDYFGRAVNVAARVGALSAAGRMVVTGPVADVLREAGRTVAADGPVRLRNVPAPVEVFNWPLDAAPAVIDPVCRMRIDQPAGWLRWADCEYAFCSLACAGRFAQDPALYIEGAGPATSGDNVEGTISDAVESKARTADAVGHRDNAK
jgi:adenylate cyclase